MSETIAILGCGWLGLPLGAELVRRGYRVKGSTTRTERLPMLAQVGFEPYLLHFSPQPQGDLPGLLTDVGVLIVAIPPRAGQQGDAFHPQQIESLIDSLRVLNKTLPVIYFSSTSVYPDLGRELTEQDEVLKTHPLIGAENRLKAAGLPLTIMRFGGLMGYDRIPGKYFIGKTVTTGDVPVNYIHRDDAVASVSELIRQTGWGEILNVVAPQHPLRREVYLRNAVQFGWEAPRFAVPDSPEAFKIVSPARLVERLDYRFLFPDPLQFFYAL